MSRFPDWIAVAFLSLTAGLVLAQAPKPTGYYGYGEPATAQQIAGWDIDVRPDGQGLPPGEGSVSDGEMLYEGQCAECHGSFGEGVGRFPAVAGGEGSLREARPHKTIGSYWKYTSTLWDYIHRAMPFTRPESLSDNEVYALTAYVLYLNDLVEDDFMLSQHNLTAIRLPNEANFIAEQRPDVKNRRCMKNCRDPGSIAIHSQAPQYIPPAKPGVGKITESGFAVTGKAVYSQSCALCHDSGVGGAPVVGVSTDWSARISAGADQLYTHAIEGFQGESGMMPARGGFLQLTDEDVIDAVDYMVEQSE